jgi:hypothetical protein
MGISYIPGPSATLAPALKDLAVGIDKYLNPNKDLQVSMQRAMASNPELVQHMADLESANPGTMSRMGLGPLADIIGGVQQSAAGAAEVATRPGAAQQAVAQQQAATSTANLTVDKNALNADLVKSAAKIMAADPSITFDAALKTLTGETQTERDANARKGKLEAAQFPNAMKTVMRAADLPADLSKIDWTDQARKFIDGQLPGSLPAAYFGNPDTARAFNEAIDAEKARRQIEASKAIAALHGDKSIDNFQIQSAFHEYQKSGGVGTLDAWKGLLFDPKMQDRARELMADPSKATTPEDKNLLETAKVTKQQIDLDKLRDVTLVNNNINSQMKAVDKADTEEERTAAINGLNQLLKARGTLGGITGRSCVGKASMVSVRSP